MNEIAAIANVDSEEVMQVIQKFRENNRSFLVLSSENIVDDPLMDISHESFIRQWHRLIEWVNEEVESAKIYMRLAETAELHEAGKAGFYREVDLQIAVKWQAEQNPKSVWAARYHPRFERATTFLNKSHKNAKRQRSKSVAVWTGIFLIPILIIFSSLAFQQRSIAIQQTELAEKQSRLAKQSAVEAEMQRDIALLEKTKADSSATIAKKQRVIADSTTIVATRQKLKADSVAVIAQEQRDLASMSAELALKQTLKANYNLAKFYGEKAANALNKAKTTNNNTDYQNALLFAMSALEPEIAKGRHALNTSLLSDLFNPFYIKTAFRECWFSPDAAKHENTVNSVAFSGDGFTLASGSSDQTIRLWDAATGKEKAKLEAHTSDVYSVAFSPDGTTLASGSKDKTIRLWDVRPFKLFLKDGRAMMLFRKFMAGARFFWQMQQEELDFKRKVTLTLYPINGYHFVHDQAYSPLLKPPAAGQSKYDQILARAQQQLAQENSLTNK